MSKSINSLKAWKKDISMFCNGYIKANNKFLKSYNSSKPLIYIVYLDVNNLYGHSMMELVPIEIIAGVSQKILV